MNSKVIIFGNTNFAKIVYYYLKTDSKFDVVAFCVDDKYMSGDTFCDLPLIPFSKINEYPPSEYQFFVAIGYQKLNAIRKSVFERLKNLGYSFITYIHSSVVLSPFYSIGENCMVLLGSTIGMFADIKDNVFIWGRSHIGHDTVINNHTFIASNASINGYVEVGEECFIGSSSTLRDHIKVGNRCLIGAGGLIMKNLPNKSAVKVKGSEVLDIDTDTMLEMGLKI